MEHDPRKVIGVGSPIVDLLAPVEDDFIKAHGGDKGGMHLVEHEDLAALVENLPGSPDLAPGGSAANTAFTLARLGSPAAMLGKLGDDAHGEFYRGSFEELGGECRFKTCDQNNTARCVSLVTPDAQRTMRTHLGAAAGLTPDEVRPPDFTGCGHAHVEGYLLFNERLLTAVLASAKQAGCTVSLDLGSFELVAQAGEKLRSLLSGYVDVVFANQDESRAFCGSQDPQSALSALGECCPTAAVKLGADGAWLLRDNEVAYVPALPAERAVDSTGAGDYWAAGFLYGHLRGYSLGTCGLLGNILGCEVVQHVGAQIPRDNWQELKRNFFLHCTKEEFEHADQHKKTA